MARLVVKNEGVVEKEVALATEAFLIGRDPECDLAINLPFLSRKHCRIRRERGRYILEDLQSLNGTLLNETPVTRQELRNADEIRIGKVELVFLEDESALGEAIEAEAEKVLEEYSLHIRAPVNTTTGEATLGGLPDSTRAPQLFFSLYQISKKLCQPIPLDQLFRVVMLSIFEVMRADRGCLFIRGKGASEPTLELCYDRLQGFSTEAPSGISTSILRRAIDKHVATLTTDAMSDPRFLDKHSIILDRIRSVLCAPLWDHSFAHGALYLESASHTYAFTKEDQALLTGIANLLALRMRLEREEQLRNSLGQYHSPAVIDLLMANAGKLETGRKQVTLFFADICNSVGLSEQLGETGIHKLLHHFYEMAAECIFQHLGHVNKYIGDAVLAVFNAPLEVESHELAGVLAARDLLLRARQFGVEHPEWAFSLRIGINTGPVIAGNIGPRNRLEYAVIGDTVNVAARLSKHETASGIAISEETWQRVADQCKGHFLEEIKVKGRSRPVRVYELSVEK
jgi:adenylate cyclase